jgi:hypothetical protein
MAVVSSELTALDVDVGQVEEEGAMAVGPHEPDRLVDEPGGECSLVGLGLEHLVVEQQRQRWELVEERDAHALDELRQREVVGLALAAHVVAVGDAEVALEAAAGGEEGRLVPAVPLADGGGGVPGLGQELGDGALVGVDAEALTREQHGKSVELVEADAGRVAAGEQCSPRRGADGRRHVEVRQTEPLGGHPVERGVSLRVDP